METIVYRSWESHEMPYAYLTLAQLRTQLQNRLDDTGPTAAYQVAELNQFIVESLRTWQAFAHYWRGRFTFNTNGSGNPFYDLTQQAGTLIPFTVKDSDLVSSMLYGLLEPQLSGGVYVGSDQFQLDDFTESIERRRNQFLKDSGTVVKQFAMNWPSSPIGRASLPDTIIDLRRVEWKDAATSVFTNVWRSEEWAATSFSPGWDTNPLNPPNGYSVAAEPPVTLQLLPPPANVGSVDTLAVMTGAVLNPSTGVLLGVPDDFSWVVKWGALADLFAKGGQAEDLLRNAYCEKRYQEGVDLARVHPSVVQASIDGNVVLVNALHSLDAFSPGWRNAAAGQPQNVAMASWNMLAVSPKADGNPHSLLLDVVSNAPVPVNDPDQIQLGREDLDAVLDYAEHLAWFRYGGAEFQGTIHLYENFQRGAAIYNSRLKAQIASLEPMGDKGEKEEILRPRR